MQFECLRIHDKLDVLASRRKLYNFLIILTQQADLAARLAGEHSDIGKWLLHNGSNGTAQVSLSAKGSGVLLTITYTAQLSADSASTPTSRRWGFSCSDSSARADRHYYLDAVWPNQHKLSELAAVMEEKSRDELFRDIRLKNEELREATEQAISVARTKSDFLANMSHEIRTPMNAIIGMTHLTLGTDLETRQRGYVERIQQSSSHLLNIINDILDFSKIESGKMGIEVIDFRLEEVLSNLVAITAEKCELKGLQLIFNVDPAVPDWVRGDPLRIGQILINYVNNAIKFTDSGEVTVNVQIAEQDSDGVKLKFTVSDTGIGISYEHQGKLFTGFQQADASTTRKYGGSGLGLAISKSLAGLMGGEVGLASKPGVGSSFWFTARMEHAQECTLPGPPDSHGNLLAFGVDEDQSNTAFMGSMMETADNGSDGSYQKGGIAAPRAAHSTPGPRRDHRNARILLVEDHEINREVAVGLFAERGIKIELAENGLIALQRVKQEQWDIVFMDMHMPVMDGLEATIEIRKLANRQQLPIIALTANAMASDRNRSLEAGMNDYLTKPILLPELWRVLDHWVASPALAANVESADDASSTAAPVELPEMEGIDRAQLLINTGGNPTLALSILHKFQKKEADFAAAFSAAMLAADTQGMERIAHTLKGTAGNVGARQLQTAAHDLEAAVRHGADMAEIRQQFVTVTSVLHRLLGDLKLPLVLPATAPPHPLGAADLSKEIAELAALLEQHDFGARKVFSQMEPQFRSSHQAVYTELCGHLDDYDFAAALGVLQAAKLA